MRQVPLKNKILFGIGDMYAGGAFLLVGLLFLKFMTDVAGLSPALAGSVFLIGKIWDAVSDPMMGVISDHTRSRFGRRRIYFLAGILPVFATFAMLWMSISSESQAAKFSYYAVSYILFNTSFTMVQVPYNAILPDMTDSYSERSVLSGIRLTFSAVSAIIAGTVPMMIIGSSGYAAMGLIFGIFYAIPWVCVFLGTYENAEHQQLQSGERVRDIIRDLPSIFGNRSFRHHAGLFICSQSAVDILTTLFIYYLTYVLRRESEFSMVMAAMLIVPVIMMPVYTKMAVRSSKTSPMHLGLVVWIAALIAALFLKPDQPGFLIYIVAACSGIGSASAVFVPWSILPDVTDVDELISGKRREGLYSGIATLLRKLAQALAVFIVGSLLDIMGYVPNVQQSPEVILGIKLTFSLLPILLLLAALLFSYRYQVTGDRHQLVIEEIERRKHHPDRTPTAACIAACEAVTGRSYRQ